MELYVDVSKDLYEAEQEILKVLPKMGQGGELRGIAGRVSICISPPL
jgi:ferritin-like metal-binding protein YciE